MNESLNPQYMLQTPTDKVGEKKCDTCIHRDDDFDCHNFCVAYGLDMYKEKEGSE